MRLYEINGKLIPCPYKNSVIKAPLYHGTTGQFAKFNRVPHGIFFTPHREHAEGNYGKDIIICYANISKLYVIDFTSEQDDEIIDALFSREYDLIASIIQQLKAKGYSAMQSISDSEMVCIFDNTEICSAITGKKM